MPIPERFRPPAIDGTELRRFCKLCTRIVRAIESGLDEEIGVLMAEWNARCQLRERSDFTSYHKSMDREEFVGEALHPVPTWIADLTFDEATASVAELMSANLDETLMGWVSTWLELNFPDANPSDLIYWPDEWFGNPELLQLELTPAQIVRYLCLASGRELPGTPADITLPHPVPVK